MCCCLSTFPSFFLGCPLLSGIHNGSKPESSNQNVPSPHSAPSSNLPKSPKSPRPSRPSRPPHRHKSLSAVIPHENFNIMSETDLGRVNGYGPISSSQRVVKPSAKKRRPPLACVQCYQRKLKCGKEIPSCGRCLKTGNAGQCTYRRSSTEYSSAHGALGDGHARGAGAMPTSLRTPVSLMETPEASRISSNLDGKMTHLRGQEPITKFYGYSYPLNFYQQVTHTFSKVHRRYGASSHQCSLRSFDLI